MNAGRELDALVAEKVMGWHSKQVPLSMFQPHVMVDLWYTAENELISSTDLINQSVKAGVLPHFTTNISDAWRIVEHMRQNKYHIATDDRHEQDAPWWCEFATEEYTIGSQATAETFPLAICLAALRAVGVSI